MPKKLKVYYAKVPNMGDVLNRDIIEKCFGYEVERHSYLTAQVSGIGSGLGNFTYEGQAWKNALKAVSGILFPEVYIWGTGFVRYKDADTRLYKRKTHVCAVRGELSKRRVEAMVGHALDVPTGDAGILASSILNRIPEKRYDVGVIAHYKEQEEPAFKRLLERYPNSCFIDVRKTPLEVTESIAQCETVISSSLHGLIIADSLRVPNVHVVVTDRLLGDGFKFDDYYSAYGLDHRFIDLRQEETGSLEDIRRSYRITDAMVEDKKSGMLASFPFPAVAGARG